MKDQVNNGGPAFPVTPTDRSGQCAPTECGMTLRDYFAAKAMVALIVARGSEIQDRGWPTYAEVDAYKIADAMLKARGAQ